MAKVRTRKRGKTFSYIFEAGRDENGKRKVVEKGGFATQDEAYDAGVDAYADWKHGNIGITSERITVGDFITQWMDAYVAKEVSDSTYATYADIYKNRIKPYFDNVVLQDLKPANVAAWLNKLYDKGYSYKSISAARGVLMHGCNYAVHPANLLSMNPVMLVKVPRQAPKNIIKRTVISKETYDILLENHPINDKYRLPIVLAYHTGMRISEIIGLEWSKVNLAEGTITVDRQLKRVQGIGYVFGALKTQSSTRTIYLDQQLIQELSEWRKVQQVNKATAGDSYIIPYVTPEHCKVQEQSSTFELPDNVTKLDLVCTSPCGNFIKHDSLSWLLKKNGLNAHSFRHTHATQLIEAGAPVKDVSARLGHASVAITEDIYTQVTEKMSRNTVALFENKVLKENADKQSHADKLQTNT